MPEVTMKDILSEMARGLAGTWVVMVADSDGMVLSSWESADNRINPEAFGGFIQIINATIIQFKASAVGFTKLDDVTFATPFTYMIAKPIAEGACFLFVSAPKTVPLGMIRMSCANFAPRLESALPGRGALPKIDGMETIVP
jgi:predicted regulator of Ras-like GTPase activity (Roadblock/LC7/MglB family)